MDSATLHACASLADVATVEPTPNAAEYRPVAVDRALMGHLRGTNRAHNFVSRKFFPVPRNAPLSVAPAPP